MERSDLDEAIRKTARNFRQMIPMLVGVLLLVSLAITAIPDRVFSEVFTGNIIVDPVIGAAVGSVAAGNPMNSYVIGGELLQSGVSIAAVIAFIVAWVSVGVVQLPAESLILGRRFALSRNITAFFLAILISVISIAIMVVI